MKKYFKPDAMTSELDELKALIKSGHTLICPKCNKELTVALTLEKAKELQIHPGIYCPENSKHFCILIELVSVRNKFRKKMNEIRAKGEKK